MHKTSLYLPERLKAALAARASRLGLSEAELVRRALEAELAGGPAPHAERPEVPMPRRLVGVGVGPGDPGLVTLAAVGAIRRADRVLAPSSAPDAVGRAEAIVRQVAPDVNVERVPFEMAPRRRDRDRSVEAAAATICAHLEAGREVAWVTLGDPLVYSTFPSVSAACRRRLGDCYVEHVPGIMAFQALAALTGTVVADDREAFLVRTALEGEDLACELGRPGTTLVVYKGGRRLPELAAQVAAEGRQARAVAGELLGMPGQRVGPLASLAEPGPASYLATVIVPPKERR